MGQKEVRNDDRLRAPQMRERRHQCAAAHLCLPGENGDEIDNRSLDLRNSPFQIEAEIERDLLVSRPAGMKATSCVADAGYQLTLDEGMDILVVLRGIGSKERRVGRPCGPNLLQRALNLRGICRGQHACVMERLRPPDASLDVVLEESTVEREGGTEFEQRRVRIAGKTARPEMRHLSVPRRLAVSRACAPPSRWEDPKS